MAPERRKRLLRIGIVVLVVVLLVVIPGYLSMQPKFFDRYPTVSAKYKTLAASTHAEGRCEQCHVSPALLPQVAHRTRMLGEFYVSLVSRKAAPGTLKTPPNSACLSCHHDLRTVSPKGDLRIPHRAHVDILKMDCVECHGYLVHEKSPEGKNTPPMAACLKCHDGDKAKNACTTCHTEKAAPDSHKSADWTVAHPDAAEADMKACAKCHAWTENWCVDCHSRKPRSHNAKDWRATHGEAAVKRRSCEACHEAAFCIRCHGEVPQANFNPDLKLVK